MHKYLKPGDYALVKSGNEKGNFAKVLRRERALGGRNDTVILEGLNKRKKAVKPTQMNPQGGFQEKEMPIHVSNVVPCNDKGEEMQHAIRTTDAGEKQLINSKNDEVIRVLKKARST